MRKSNKEPKDVKEAQLNAIILLLGELLPQLATDKSSAQAAKEKVAVILATGGISQERVGKLLSIQKKKVGKAVKKIKI